MVKLDCTEGGGCQYQTQDLPYDQAERIRAMHLERKHSQRVSCPSTMSSDRMPGCASAVKHQPYSDPTPPHDAPLAAEFPMPVEQFYYSLTGFGFPMTKLVMNEMMQKYKNAGRVVLAKCDLSKNVDILIIGQILQLLSPRLN